MRGTLSCLDAASGKLLWRKDDIKGGPRFFTASSPIVLDGQCIAQLGGGKNGELVAYDLTTGDEKWKWTGDSPAYSSPALMTVGGTKLIIAMTETKLVAVEAADGKLVWQAPFAVQRGGYNAATPIVNGQTLIYTGSGRGATAVKFDKEGDKITAKELWKNPDKSVQFNTPVLKDGLLYGLTQSNEFFCLNAETGKTVWSAPRQRRRAACRQRQADSLARVGDRAAVALDVAAACVAAADEPDMDPSLTLVRSCWR